jgi:hypothetical protein
VLKRAIRNSASGSDACIPREKEKARMRRISRRKVAAIGCSVAGAFGSMAVVGAGAAFADTHAPSTDTLIITCPGVQPFTVVSPTPPAKSLQDTSSSLVFIASNGASHVPVGKSQLCDIFSVTYQFDLGPNLILISGAP